MAPTTPINFTEALRQRTERALFHISQRAYKGDPNNLGWAGIGFGEEWIGEYTNDTEVVYTRKAHPEFKVILRNIQASNIASVTLGDPVTIDKKDEEVRIADVNVEAGGYTNTVTHTFAKTTSLEEAHQASFGLALEVAGGQKAPTTGGFELTTKLNITAGYQYNNKKGSSEVTTDTETRTFTLTPADAPFRGKIVAKRSVQKQSLTSRASVAFEHQIILQRNGQTDYQWDSWDQLMRVFQGLAPTNRALAREFTASPLAQDRLDAINAFRIPEIVWETQYDGVVAQEIAIVRTNMDEYRAKLDAQAAKDAQLKQDIADRERARRDFMALTPATVVQPAPELVPATVVIDADTIVPATITKPATDLEPATVVIHADVLTPAAVAATELTGAVPVDLADAIQEALRRHAAERKARKQARRDARRERRAARG